MSFRVIAACFVFGVVLTPSSRANTISLTGSLDPNNANDVFLFPFVLGSSSNLTIQSYGYGGSGNAPGGTNAAGAVIAAGGFDPYVSFFAGIGGAATFVASNDDGSCPPGTAVSFFCPDSTLGIASLPAGPYIMALTVFDNFSFAENFGTGTLGDGFIGLGDYFDSITGTVRSSNFAVDITSAADIVPAAVPEPASWLLALAACGIVAVGSRSKHRRAKAGFTTPELLVVVALISILIGAAIPAVNKVREAAIRIVGENDLTAICHGEVSYRQNHPAYAGSLPLLNGLIPAKLLGGVADGWGFAIVFADQNSFKATGTYLSTGAFEPKLATDQSCQIGETFFSPIPPQLTQDKLLLSAATLVAQFLNADPAAIPQVRSFVNSPGTFSQALSTFAPPATGVTVGITIPGILAWGQQQPAPVANFVQFIAQQLGWGANGEDLSQIPPVNPADIQWDQSRNLFSFDGLGHLTNLMVSQPLAFSLTVKLELAEEAEEHGNGRLKNEFLEAYRHELSALSGKFISAGDANTLSTLSLAFNDPSQGDAQ